MNRRSRVALLALLLALAAAFSGSVAAQTPDGVTVTVAVERQGETIGDPIIVTVTVRHPLTGSVAIDPGPVPLGNLEPAAPILVTSVDGADATEVSYSYSTRAFQTGLLPVVIPPFRYTNAGAGIDELIRPPAQTVDVRSVLPSDPALLVPRPLKPLETIGGAGVSIVVILAPILGALALIAVVVMARRLRRRVFPPAVVVPPASPAETAAKALAEIGGAGLLPSAIDDYCARINSTVRSFLEARYHVPAPSLTSRQLADRLARAGADAGTVRMVASLCGECDAVAYARARPAQARADRYLDLAVSIVQAQPAAAAAAAPPERWARMGAGPSGGENG